MSSFAFDKVASKSPGAISERYVDRTGAHWMVVKKENIREIASLLKNDPELDFKLFLSMDAVDRLLLPQSDPRYEVVYFLYSPARRERARLKVRVSEAELKVPSITSVYQGANWAERFVWDFYGIDFPGHPGLKRILMYEEFNGHPLRKDYELRGRQPLIPERPLKDIFRGPGTNGPLGV